MKRSRSAASGFRGKRRHVRTPRFSIRSANIEVLRDYVWGLMGLRPDKVLHSAEGFAQNNMGTVLFIAASGRVGSIITCFPLHEFGVERINGAISQEYERMRDELMRGEYVGNLADAHNAIVEDGVDSQESGVFEFVNGAKIARLDG